MENLALKLLLIFCMIYVQFPAALGYEWCINNFCDDDGLEIGYCCGTYDLDCCYYTAVWGLWYFWLCVALAILSIILVIVRICLRIRYRQRLATVTTTTRVLQGVENPNYIQKQDYPPSYQQVEHQHGLPGNQVNCPAVGNYYNQPQQPYPTYQ